MSGPPPLPVNVTIEPAQAMSGFAPAPVLGATDHGLAEFLGRPHARLHDQLQVDRLPHEELASAAHPGGAFNPTGLISPVTQALSTLGNGIVSGPTQALSGIVSSIEGVAGPLQHAMAGLESGWQGATATAALGKTHAALNHGADVATQSNGLHHSLSAAGAHVAHARARLLAIIDEFMLPLPHLLTLLPWTLGAIIANAAHAVGQAGETMGELEAGLAAEAAAVTAIGAPLAITAAPQIAAIAAAALPAAMQVGSMGLGLGVEMGSTGMSAAMGAMSAGMGAASSATGPAAAAKTGTLVDSSDADSTAPPAGHGGPVSNHATLAGAVAPAGLGAGVSPSGAPVSRTAAPLTPAVSARNTASESARSTRPATEGAMPGAGMMGAPLAGGATANGASSAHTAASFLHTTDQGDKIVDKRGTVAPPVLGEPDPTRAPDIELRI